ncbi:membrane hypothetical protein [Vibrio crassostreae]|nr:membrane hypothetical protein [Vibrio crassostreae]
MTFVGWFYSEGLIQMAVGSNDTVYYSLGLLAVAHVAAYDVSHRTRNPMHITVYWPAKWADVPCHIIFGMNLLLSYFLGMYLHENAGLDVELVLMTLCFALFVIPYLIAPFFKFYKTYHKFGSEENFNETFMPVVYISIAAFFGKMLIVDILLGYNAFPSIYDWYWLPYGEPLAKIGYLDRIGTSTP